MSAAKAPANTKLSSVHHPKYWKVAGRRKLISLRGIGD
jgi:hypothetical protein